MTPCRALSRNSRRRIGRLRAIAWLILIAIGTPGVRGEVHVTTTGHVGPDGSAGRPFRTLASALERLPCSPGSDIVMHDGVYRETLTIDRPCTISAVGNAEIGRQDQLAETSLAVITVNTHLFGDDPGPSWQDEPRRDDLGQALLDADADVVTMQEIWDEDLFWGGDDQGVGLITQAQYPFGAHGSAVGDGGCVLPTVANSGLAVMSHIPPNATHQDFYGEDGELCLGCLVTDCSPECLASKSYFLYRFHRNGIPVALFTTHTQSGSGGDQVDVRRDQLIELAGAVQGLREAEPSVVVVVTGDLNVPGETGEYENTLAPLMAGSGGYDAHRNAPGFACDGDRVFTLDTDNELAQYFEDNFDFDCGVQITPQRLDYVFFMPPADGSVDIHVEDAHVMRFRGPVRCEDDFCSDETSDHFGIFARLRMLTLP